MRTFTSFSRLSFSVSALALSAAFATPAFAEGVGASAQPNVPTDCSTIENAAAKEQCVAAQTPNAPPTASKPNEQSIIVTGTRIKRPNLESPVPITSITNDELTQQGQVTVGDALNDLPALRSTFSQQNSGRFIGTAGQNFLDLRGLGTTRTLVLVNGRRFVSESPGDFIVDVDNIPQDLIDRIDVVTGGESAIYGSDAVAGVVNFVLKRNFDGLRVRGQEGISKYGDRNVGFVSTTIGRNFADGRGNIAVDLEYTHAEPLNFRDRSHFANVCGFEPNENTRGEASLPNGSDNIPDRIFVCGIRNPFVTTGGNVAVLTTSGQNLSFDPAGNLVVTPPADRSFLQFSGGTVISNNPLIGSTLRETGQLAVGRDRYQANLLGHYDVSDAFKPFIEGTFTYQKVRQEFQPSFFQGRLAGFFGPVGVQGITVPSLSCSNAFLTPQNIAALRANGFCVTRNTIPLNRFNVDLGARKEIDYRRTYRIVAGVTGDFLQDWHYEVSLNYGHHHATNAQLNDLLLADQFGNPAGFTLAVDAVRDANGNIVCRSTLTDPGNGCVPIDLFGENRASPEAIAFVNRTSHLFQSATEVDGLGYVSGSSAQWFSLPGGPIGFSLGLEYRRETAESHADPVSASGGTFFNAFPPFNPPAFKVFEGFGELNVPILKDLPLVHELTVSGAARESHYNTSAGHTFAWNVNAIYSPVRDIRFRGNYSKSVRVPTLSDLFTPPTVNFNFVTDPCDQLAAGGINAGSNRTGNCAALGVPTTILAGSPCADATHPVGSPFTNCIANSQTIEITSAGNPNLTAETGKSLTLGAVITPRFLPNFNLSVDYFRINVTNLISVLGAQQILNLCVDQPSVNNQFCPLINPRDQFGLFAQPSALLSAGVNFARQISRGIDFDLSYTHRFANGHRLNLRGFATYTLERTNFTDPTNPNFGNRILSELGDPVFSGTAIAGYTIGGLDLRYTLRYIGSMTDFNFEDTHSFEGRPPQNADVADQGHINTGAVWYHDIRVGYTLKKKYEFYAGVDNIFNRLPPLGLTGSGAGSAIYTNYGRFMYAGVVLDLK